MVEVWFRQTAPYYGTEDGPTPFPVPGWMWDRDRGPTLYGERMRFIRRMDELGFDGIIFTEHHAGPNGALMPSPIVLLAAASQVTERIKLATMGITLALYPHPLRVAEELAVIDNLSGGRLVPGFISGTPQNLFAYNVPPEEERDRYHEAYDLMVKAWTEDEPFEWHSKYYDYECVAILPRPFQRPHPRAWTTATSRESIEWAATKQMGFMSHGPTIECANRLSYYQQYAEQECGWSPGPADLGIAREMYVVPTKTDIDERIREVFERDRVHAFTQRSTHPRLRAIDAERFKVRSYDYLTAVDSPFQGAAMSVEGRCSGQFLAGDPDSITEEIIAQQKATGAGVLVVRSELGSVHLAEALEGLELFAREVLPVIQRL
jgi:alkanesulfonate monooxygenase SsuD/methylene tetrahydromethanopterin reductase-like flavin-dependent oxidoreductase (luciferase family)